MQLIIELIKLLKIYASVTINGANFVLLQSGCAATVFNNFGILQWNFIILCNAWCIFIKNFYTLCNNCQIK